MDVLILHAVTEDLAAYLSEVTEGDLGFDTPSRGVTVGDLIRHLLEEVAGATAALFGDANPSARVAAVLNAWDGRPVTDGGGLDGPYRQAARALCAAYETSKDVDGPLQMGGRADHHGSPDLAKSLICDTVADTWDLAQTLGITYEPAPEVADLVRHAIQTPADVACNTRAQRAQRALLEDILNRAPVR